MICAVSICEYSLTHIQYESQRFHNERAAWETLQPQVACFSTSLVMDLSITSQGGGGGGRLAQSNIGNMMCRCDTAACHQSRLT